MRRTGHTHTPEGIPVFSQHPLRPPRSRMHTSVHHRGAESRTTLTRNTRSLNTVGAAASVPVKASARPRSRAGDNGALTAASQAR